VPKVVDTFIISVSQMSAAGGISHQNKKLSLRFCDTPSDFKNLHPNFGKYCNLKFPTLEKS